jgi:hypothetical protein
MSAENCKAELRYSPFRRSNPSHEKQYEEDDQDDTDATVTKSVTIAAEPAAESPRAGK